MNKQEILSKADKLTYGERIQLAAKLGRDQKDSPKLRELIDALLTHPAPESPQMEVEEEFTEILPPQVRNTGKFFNEDQLALTAAVSSKTCLDLLHREYATNPSILFKKLLVKAIVRQEKDDDKLYNMIVNEVPKLQRKLIHACIRYRRIGIIEAAHDVLRKSQGVACVAEYLHGCSGPFVLEHLRDEEILYSKSLSWGALARHHGDVIITLIREALTKCSTDEAEEWHMATVWTEWAKRLGNAGKKELLFNSGHSGNLLKLALEVPILDYVGDGNKPRRKDAKSSDVVVVLPSMISAQLGLFIKKHPQEMLKLAKSCLYKSYKGHLVCTTYDIWTSASGWSRLRSNRFSWILELVQDLFAKSDFASFYAHYGVGADRQLVQGLFAGSFLEHLSHKQMLQIINLALDHLFVKLRPNPDDKSLFTDETEDVRESLSTWLASILGAFVSSMKVFRNDENILYVRERIIENDNIDEGSTTQPSSRPRARRGQVVKTKAAGAVKRIHKLSDTEKAEELAKISKLKAQVADAMRANYSRLVSIITSKEWERAEKGTESSSNDREVEKAVREKRESYTNSYFLPILKAIDNHVDLIHKFTDEILTNYLLPGQNVSEYCWTSIKDHLLSTLRGHAKNPKLTAEEREEARLLQARLVDFFMKSYQTDHVLHVPTLLSIADYANLEQRLALFKSYSSEEKADICANHPGSIQPLFELVLEHREKISTEDLAYIYSELAKMFEEGVASEATRDELRSIQNIEDNKIRQALTKAADSNNLSERQFAFRTLVTASRLSMCPEQMKRTLVYFTKKIKNEAADNRATALEVLTENLSANIAPSAANTSRTRYSDLVLSEKCLPAWETLLQHTLEAPDFKEEASRLEAVFNEVSQAALARGAGNTAGVLFNFGVELQWRIEVHNKGLRKASKGFRIQFPSGLKPFNNSTYFRKGTEAQFVTGVSKAYSDRILAKNPKFFEVKESITVFKNLFPIVRKAWLNIPELTEHAARIIKLIKAHPLDEEGLYILRGDYEGIEVFEKIFSVQNGYKDRKGEEWYEIPVLVEYVETMLHSTQAPRVLFRWLQKETGFPKTKLEKKQRRDAVVEKLLKISSSAIHLRFVWRHLVRYQQQKLDAFLGVSKSFRGVFFVKPENRGALASSAEARRSAWKSNFVTDIAEHKKKQKEEEDEIEIEREEFLDQHGDSGREFDHPDFFILPACYGLHRLLPRQLDALGKQWMNRVLNEDAALPSRVDAAIRWTLMPNVSYVDVVKFFNEYEEKAPVNIIEAILKGVMQNDEPCAPLQFLLSPKFLGSDRARVAMYCIAKCVPYMPSTQMTEMLDMVLTGKRRTALKVTAYKEIIRLLCGRPTPKHMEMVLREWNRPVLHRDVRITIVQKCVEFLSKAEFDEIAWQIFDSCITTHKDNAEMQTALLGIQAADANSSAQRRARIESISYVSSGELTGAFFKSRLLEHYDALTKSKIPEKHCARYATSIVHKLAAEAVDPDVKFLAISVLPSWREYVDKHEIIKLQLPYVLDTSNDVLDNEKRDIQAVHLRRFQVTIKALLDIAGFSVVQYSDEDETVEPLRDAAIQVIKANIDAYKALPLADRVSKDVLLARLKLILDSCQTLTAIPARYENQLVAAYGGLGMLFYKKLIEREIAQYGYASYDFGDKAPCLLHRLFTHAVTYPSTEKMVRKLACSLMAHSASMYDSKETRQGHSTMIHLMENSLTSSDEVVRKMHKYTALSHYIILIMLPQFVYLFEERATQVSDFICNAITFVESNPKEAKEIARSTNEQVAGLIVSCVVAYFNKHSTSNYNIRIPAQIVKDLLKRIIFLAFDESNPVAAKTAWEVVSQLVRSQSDLVVQVTPELVSAIMHRFVVNTVQRRENNDNLVSTFKSLIESVQKATISPSAGYYERDIFTSETLDLIDSLVNNQLLTKPYGPAQGADVKALYETLAKSAPDGYNNVMFETSLSIVADGAKWSQAIRTRPQIARQLLHQAIVRATAYGDYTPRLSPMVTTNSIVRIITRALTTAFETQLPAYEVSASSDSEADAAYQADKEAKFQESLGQLLALLQGLLDLSLISADADPVVAMGGENLPFSLAEYRHMALRVVLKLIKYFGTKTVIPRKKVQDDMEEEDTEAMDTSADKEKEGEAEKKAEDKKKKKKGPVNMTWRPQFTKILDSLSTDSDVYIAQKASAIVTSSWL